MLVGVLTAAVALLFVASAAALSGSAIDVGSIDNANYAPAVAVAENGTAYIAWPNAEVGTVQTCTIPAGASSCKHSQTITPDGPSSGVYGPNVQVLLDGTTVVLLINTGNRDDEYGPVQEWTSTNEGETFEVVSGGRSVAYDTYGHSSPLLGGETDLNSAVVLPGGGENALGIGWTDAE